MSTALAILQILASVIVAWFNRKPSDNPSDPIPVQVKPNVELQKKFDKIDTASPDLAIALKRLHDRATNGPGSATKGDPS